MSYLRAIASSVPVSRAFTYAKSWMKGTSKVEIVSEAKFKELAQTNWKRRVDEAEKRLQDRCDSEHSSVK